MPNDNYEQSLRGLLREALPEQHELPEVVDALFSTTPREVPAAEGESFLRRVMEKVRLRMAQPLKNRSNHNATKEQFALAADDGQNTPSVPSNLLFPVIDEPIPVDDVLHKFVTNGDDIFIVLLSGERRRGLLFDEKRIMLELRSEGNEALLVSYGRAKFLNFLDRMKREPGQHVIRWADADGSNQHD